MPKRLTRQAVREKQKPIKRATESRAATGPLGEKAHLPQNAAEAVNLISKNELDCMKEFRGGRIGTLKIEARPRQQETEVFGDCSGKAEPPTVSAYAR